MTPHALAPALLLLAASAGAWSPSPPLRPFGRSSLSSMRASPRTIDFCKYEGLGNDFILVDDRGKSEPSLTPAESARLCDRNFGVGGDSVIFALDPTPSSATADVRMRIYNSDGSEPEMCGNGIRCYAQFLKDLGEEKATFVVETLAGPIVPQMNADGTITVDMGEPILNVPDVPCTLPPGGTDAGLRDGGLRTGSGGHAGRENQQDEGGREGPGGPAGGRLVHRVAGEQREGLYEWAGHASLPGDRLNQVNRW